MEISKYCYKCKNYDTQPCKEKGYVSDMQNLEPKCYKTNIIKPYEWIGILYGHTHEESKCIWDSAWEFINTMDILSDFKEFSNNHKQYNLNDFMDYLEEKYEYHDDIGDLIFNMIDTDDFAMYLQKKYQNFTYWTETTAIHKFKFNL